MESIGPALAVSGLRAGYGEREILRGVDLSLESGGRLALLGPNGSGKTTLFRAILGLLRPFSGAISVWGGPPSREGRIAAVLEQVAFPPRILSREWMLHHARLAGLREPGRASDALLRAWGIPGAVECDRLSQGQRRRLSVLRGLASRPGLLLLDEPTANLDPEARDEFWSLLDGWADSSGAAVLVTSHQLEEVAGRRGECAVLGDGRILHRGPARLFGSSFPASRLLRLDREVPAEKLAGLLSPAGFELGPVRDGTGREHRVVASRGVEDHPRLIALLSREGIGVELLSEDGTTLREAYRACLGREPGEAPSASSFEAPSIPVRAAGQVLGWGRFHLKALLRDRRLLLPQVVLLAILCAAVCAALPAGTPGELSAAVAALAGLLPASLCAALCADIVAGERDRRTLEDTLALPWPFRRAAAGSILSAVSSCMALSVVAVVVAAAVLARCGSPVPAVSVASLLLLFLPSSLLFAGFAGFAWSLRSRTARAAAQLSTLSTIPLLLLAQALPRILPGPVAPWACGGAVLACASSLLAWSSWRSSSPERLLE